MAHEKHDRNIRGIGIDGSGKFLCTVSFIEDIVSQRFQISKVRAGEQLLEISMLDKTQKMFT